MRLQSAVGRRRLSDVPMQITTSRIGVVPECSRVFDVMPIPIGGMNALISRLEYPTKLRRQRIGAEVRLLILFDSLGRVQDCTGDSIRTPIIEAGGS